jgi:hypothetical protein
MRDVHTFSVSLTLMKTDQFIQRFKGELDQLQFNKGWGIEKSYDTKGCQH